MGGVTISKDSVASRLSHTCEPREPKTAQRRKTMIFKMVALAIIALLLVMNYAVLVVASRAEERAERMYRRWKSERSNSTPDK